MKKVSLLMLSTVISVSSFGTRYLVQQAPGGWRAAGAGEVVLTTGDMPLDYYVYTGADDCWPSEHALKEGDEVWFLAGEWNIENEMVKFGPFTADGDNYGSIGVNYYGGFIGTETSVDQRALSDLDNNGIIGSWEFTNATVLNGKATLENKFGVAQVRYTKLDGFTIQGGINNANGPAGVQVGVKDSNDEDSWLVNSIVRNNLIHAFGGGTIYCGAVGADARSFVSSCLIENNVIESDKAAYGAGVALTRGATVANCVVRGNKNLSSVGGNNRGGGIFLGGSTAPISNQVYNCLVYNNLAYQGAGIFSNNGGTNNKIVGCTVFGNVSVSNNAGVMMNQMGTMYNSILLNNYQIPALNDFSSFKLANYVLSTNPGITQSEGYYCITNGGAAGNAVGVETCNVSVEENFDMSSLFVSPNTFKGPGATAEDFEAIRKSNFKLVSDATIASGFGADLSEVEELIEAFAKYDFFGNSHKATPDAGAISYAVTTGIGNNTKIDCNVISHNGMIEVVSGDNSDVLVYNTLGAFVKCSTKSTNHTIALENGVYVVYIKTAKGAQAIKCIVK